MRRLCLLLLLGIAAGATEPWTASDLIQPEQASTELRNAVVIHVGFPVLYRSVHISGSVFAGPASKDEGIDALQKAVASQPKTREIILYCGCCPFDKCPNIRPAFAALHAMGFTHVRVVHIATNLKTDWTDKGFPVDKRAE